MELLLYTKRNGTCKPKVEISNKMKDSSVICFSIDLRALTLCEKSVCFVHEMDKANLPNKLNARIKLILYRVGDCYVRQKVFFFGVSPPHLVLSCWLCLCQND